MPQFQWVRKWTAVLAVAFCVLLPAARALDVFKLDPVINLRFSSGNYTDGNLRENPHRRFLLAGHDLSGLGWGPGNYGVTLISPRHLVTAAHVSPLANSTVSFLNRDGVIKHYLVESVFYVEHSVGVRTDLAVCRLTKAIPPEDHVGFFPTLRLASNTDYSGLRTFSFGGYQSCGMATIARSGNYDAMPFGHPDNVPDNIYLVSEWRQVPGEAQANGHDSGSPTFVLYHGQLALVGIHSAVSVHKEPYLSLDVMVPAYFTQIKAFVAKDGYDFVNLAAPPAVPARPAR